MLLRDGIVRLGPWDTSDEAAPRELVRAIAVIGHLEKEIQVLRSELDSWREFHRQLLVGASLPEGVRRENPGAAGANDVG